MTKIEILKMNGEKAGEIQLASEIFGVKSNPVLLHQAVISQLSNIRSGCAHAKTRSEVSGGGKKPWKQKGTGNARSGSSRSPLWIGGGVTFGPRNSRNWVKVLPKKISRKSIFMALSEKIKDNKVIIVDKIEFSKIKTKQAEEFFEKMPIKEGTILVVIPKSDMNVELSLRNLPYVKVIMPNCLNTYDIIKYDSIIVSKEALGELEKLYLKKDTKKIATAKSHEKTTKAEIESPAVGTKSRSSKTANKENKSKARKS